MILLSLLNEDVIKVGLESEDKEELFEEMVDILVRTGKIKDRKKALESLWEREKKGTTGIGKGVAIPHSKTSVVDELVAAVGISKEGIEYESLDGELVYLVFLMFSAEGTAGPHIEALADVARLVETPGFCRKLREAKDSREAMQIIRNFAAELKENAGAGNNQGNATGRAESA